MPAIKYVTVGANEYEVVSDDARLLTEYLHRVWVKAGKPDRVETESSWKVVDAIMQVWAAGWPEEFLDWKYGVEEQRAYERTVHEAEKDDGGHFPIGYPQRVLQLLRVYFKNDRFQDRKLIKKFVSRYPYLKITKFKI